MSRAAQRSKLGRHNSEIMPFLQSIDYTLVTYSKLRAVMTRKRNLYAELTEGFDALADRRAGKRTLRTHVVKLRPAPKITARELARLRKQMNLSRGLFAGFLRTNVRTLENWEQGRARPNAQAALLIRLVQRYPDTVQRLAKI